MMASQQTITRRRLLGATVVAAGGLLASSASAALDEFPSTDHFWYRPQPKGPFIDSQCDNKAFGFEDGKISLSEDNGRTWPYSAAFPNARYIVFSHIMKNGNILFSALARLYLSTDNLKTYAPVTVKDTDGSDYIPHTPKNPSRPGWYFHSLTGVNSWEVNGKEMLVWGNYCNVIGGATPVNIYYSTDNGRTVKIAYSFGQNPFFRDNGSGGGGKTGTALGHPVQDATTSAAFPLAGVYRMWVRTRDWAAPWKNPDTSTSMKAVGTPGQLLRTGTPGMLPQV